MAWTLRLLFLSQKTLLVGTTTLLGAVLVPWYPPELGQVPGRGPVVQAHPSVLQPCDRSR